MPDKEGKYRIHAVSEQTGVPAATLRAWERRYGLPHPGRSDSAYRIYSDHDVAMVRRVRELCDNGMSPSEAARVVLEESATWTDAPANEADPYERVRQTIVAAVRAFDPKETAYAVRHAMAIGPATSVVDRILLPAMFEVGELWHEGKISIGEEHMANRICGDAINAMIGLIQSPDTDRTVVVACFADEQHSLPADGVAVHLASWGHRPVRLGQRTPPSAIGHAVEELNPNLVALSATMMPEPHRARELVEGYANACGDIPWIVGGAASESLAELVESAGGTVSPAGSIAPLRGVIEGLMSGRRRKSKR